jgi:hypothetical protein
MVRSNPSSAVTTPYRLRRLIASSMPAAFVIYAV